MPAEIDADMQAATSSLRGQQAIAARLFLSAPSETKLDPSDTKTALNLIGWLNGIYYRIKGNEGRRTFLPARLTVGVRGHTRAESEGPIDGTSLDGLSALFPDLTFETQSNDSRDARSNCAIVASGTASAINDFEEALRLARKVHGSPDVLTELARSVTAVKYDEPRIQMDLKDIRDWDWNTIAVLSVEWKQGLIEADVRLEEDRWENMAFYRGRIFTPKQTFDDRDFFIRDRGHDYQDRISNMHQQDLAHSR